MTLVEDPTPPRASREDGAVYFVWGFWLFLFAATLACVLAYGRRLPFCDDWDFVEVISGVRPFRLSWLWAPHNEHRTPLPKLIFLGLCPATGFDFRALVVVNLALMGAVSAWLLAVVRKLRGWTSYVDTFIPLVYLHLGNAGFFWAFEMQFTLGVFFSSALLAVLAGCIDRVSSRDAGLAGLCVLGLSLSGLNGLLMAAIMLAWVGIVGLKQWRGDWPGGRLPAAMLATVLIATALLIVLNFYGLHSEPNPDLQGARDLRRTPGFALAVLNSIYLNITRFWWPASGLVLPALFAVALAGLAAALRAPRPRELGMLCLLAAEAAVVLAVAWGRGAHVWNSPGHYAMLAIPGLAWLFLALEFYVTAAVCRPIQMFLLVLSCASFADDRLSVASWKDLRRAEAAIERELASGADVAAIVDSRFSDLANEFCGLDDPERRIQIINCLNKIYRNK